MTSKKKLDKAIILKCLNELNSLAKSDGSVIKLSVYGGAVMCILHKTRYPTYDIDAIFSTEDASPYINKIANKLNIQQDWLNDDVSVCISDMKETSVKYTKYSNLDIKFASAEYILAMKAFACRNPEYPSDLNDIKELIQVLKVDSYLKLEKVVKKYYPLKYWKEKAKNTVKTLFK